ncbi:Sepiapterin reductase [Strongyloides ratti]|uniref:Sepiapterin reductase n=1 Tax=Strongyloides ratti TaxID=34506 RepID=A0A090MXZ0_STRRB|nr:Sepiapterin reductase [Strongyloides ratti]CEF66269.1 Sepiapterin reductase [Strongyloides ratti]
MDHSFNDKKFVAVVTGATEGIGHQLTLSLSEIAGNDSIIYIIGRDIKKLSELRNAINLKYQNIQCVYWCIDFEKDDDEPYEKLSIAFENDIKKDGVQKIGIFHIAGNIGDIKNKAQDIISRKSWDSHLKVNVTSMILLNNNLLKSIRNCSLEYMTTIVSITSLLAIKPFKCFSQYSVGHAAREAFFRSLAIEMPQLRILSYSPGPVKTRLRDYVSKNAYDEDIRYAFSHDDNHESGGRVISTEETIGKLLEYLRKDKYVSGCRVDIFDI